MSEESVENNQKIAEKSEQDEEKQALEDGTPTESTIGGSSWLPDLATSFVNTAKRKTKSTFEIMKKDINEISDSLQHGANTLADVTVKQAQFIQHLIAPVPDQKEENAEEERKAETKATELSKDDAGASEHPIEENESSSSKVNEKPGLFSLGWMKQVVDTVHKFATEDTTKEEDECTEELLISQSGRRTILDQFTLTQMQNEPRTFLQAPQENVDLYNEWLDEFRIGEYNGEINMLLSNNPRLREIYAELVPSQVDNNSFWNRYFFKVHLKELDKQIAMSGVTALNLDKIGSTAKGHSPAPSNGKDSWSLCSGEPIEEKLNDVEAIEGGNDREEEASTPKPRGSKPVEEVEDWEDCVGENVESGAPADVTKN